MNAHISLAICLLSYVLSGSAYACLDDDDDDAVSVLSEATTALNDPKLVERLVELFPARAWGQGKHGCAPLYLTRKKTDVRGTWLDTLLNKPVVLKQYDQLAGRLEQGVANLKDPNEVAVNAGILALIRARQGQLDEADARRDLTPRGSDVVRQTN